jgi:hypothetical protein
MSRFLRRVIDRRRSPTREIAEPKPSPAETRTGDVDGSSTRSQATGNATCDRRAPSGLRRLMALRSARHERAPPSGPVSDFVTTWPDARYGTRRSRRRRTPTTHRRSSEVGVVTRSISMKLRIGRSHRCPRAEVEVKTPSPMVIRRCTEILFPPALRLTSKLDSAARRYSMWKRRSPVAVKRLDQVNVTS